MAKNKKIEEIELPSDTLKTVRVKFLRHLTIGNTTYWRDKEYDLDLETFESIQNKSVIQIIK